MVKTKSRQNMVEILPLPDLLDVLQARNVIKEDMMDEADLDSMKKNLWLDPKFQELLLVKKLQKAIECLSQNDELKQIAIEAIPDDSESESFVKHGQKEDSSIVEAAAHQEESIGSSPNLKSSSKDDYSGFHDSKVKSINDLSHLSKPKDSSVDEYIEDF